EIPVRRRVTVGRGAIPPVPISIVEPKTGAEVSTKKGSESDDEPFRRVEGTKKHRLHPFVGGRKRRENLDLRCIPVHAGISLVCFSNFKLRIPFPGRGGALRHPALLSTPNRARRSAASLPS